MLIAFEGIDGAGKTTTAPLVAQCLAERGYSVLELSKRRNGVRAEFAGEQLRAVADRLWNVPHDERLGTLGTPHWIHLNAAYFAGTHYALTAQLGPDEIAVFDNWINKFVARIVSNGDIPLADALAIIASVPQPDLVFFLDVPPSVAVHRRADYSRLERGSLGDGSLGEGELEFETYQTAVGDQLRLMADRFGWSVVATGSRSAAEIAADVADRVVGHLAHGAAVPAR